MAQISFLIKTSTPSVSASACLIHTHYDRGNYTNKGTLIELADSETDLDPMAAVYRSAMLSDTRVVTVGMNTDELSNAWFVRCYAAGDLTTESWTYEITGSDAAGYADICVLEGGNIAVVWVDYDYERAYFTIISPAGAMVKGMTLADTITGEWDYADFEEWAFVTPLADGGFSCFWSTTGGRGMISTWTATGVNTSGTIQINNYYNDSWPIQMPDDGGSGLGYVGGWVMTFDPSNDQCNFYDPDDLRDEYAGVDLGTNVNPTTTVMSAKSTLWTDRVAYVWGHLGMSAYCCVMDNDRNLIIENQLIAEDILPTDFVALPDGKFIMSYIDPFTPGSAGQLYYILDTDLEIFSGPHVAFTDVDGETEQNIHGCSAGTGSITPVDQEAGELPPI